jgi:uncharacterized protein YoxC
MEVEDFRKGVVDMNIWYWIAVAIVIVGVLIFVGCLVAAIGGIMKQANLLKAAAERIQLQQMQPLQAQMNTLNTTVQTIQQDVNRKKNDLQYVTECFKGIKTNVTQLSQSSKLQTKIVLDQIEQDPHVQQQTEQWTNTALGFLQRKK